MNRPSITESVRRGTCANHRDRVGTPHPHDWVPYCDECKKNHKTKDAPQ